MNVGRKTVRNTSTSFIEIFISAHFPRVLGARFHRPMRFLMLFFVLLGCPVGNAAEEEAPHGPLSYTERFYSSETVDIKMRDGVNLVTEIIRPKKDMGPLPVFMVRTPYGASNYDFWGEYAGPERMRYLAEEGYIFVLQETRGTERSGGVFELNPPRKSATNPNAVDEATDTYDTLEWFAKNLKGYNGNVGVAGCSYPGYAAVMAGLSGHPSMKAVSPQAAMADLYRGDDFYWNGIPLLASMPMFLTRMETRGKAKPRYDKSDAYDWYRHVGALKDFHDAAFQKPGRLWEEILPTDRLTEYWESRVLANEAENLKVPSLHVFGWYDGEDFPGPYRLFQAVDELDDKEMHRAIIGPWNHCMWDGAGPGDSLGPLKFYSATAEKFKRVEADFFAFHLKGKGSIQNMPQVQVFETGSGGRWLGLRRWPAKPNPATKTLFLDQNEYLSADQPNSSTFEDYVSDPNKPVPYARRPIGFFGGPDLVPGDGKERSLFLLEDQRFVHGRPDVLIWVSEPLEHPLVLDGQPVFEFFAETTGTDVDWIVQLVDVYPDDYDPHLSGYRRPVTRGALRASLRKSLKAAPVALVPGQVEEYSIPLEARRHKFAKGHRILISLQSTYFPYLARNPQKLIAPEKATVDDFTKVENRIYQGGSKASRIVLPFSDY